MAFLKRLFRIMIARAEAVFDWTFGQRNNPLAELDGLDRLRLVEDEQFVDNSDVDPVTSGVQRNGNDTGCLIKFQRWLGL